MTTLVDTLKDAAHIKAVAQVTPEIEKLGKILDVVASYQEAVIEEAEVAIVNVALTALGQPAVTPELDVAALRAELEGLFLAFGGTKEAAPAPAAPSQPKPTKAAPVAAAAPAPLPAERPEPKSTPTAPVVPSGTFAAVLKETPLPKPVPINPLDVEKAWALIQEVEKTDCASEHAVRLEMLFQAWAAEARLIMERLPPGNEAHEALGERVIRHVTNLKKELNVGPYIKGLAFGASANWYRIAGDSRKRIARYDRDVKSGSSNGITPNGKLKNPVLKSRPVLANGDAPSSASSYTWPDLPNLRERMKDYPLLIIGGRTRDAAKLDAVYERFGVRCEWCEVDPGSSRALDALSERIANGKVAGVMLVENFLSHKAYRKFTKAADQGYVPLVLTGKGGVGAIGEALQATERQISIALYKIPKVEMKEGSAS